MLIDAVPQGWNGVPRLFISPLSYDACLFEHNVYIKSGMSHSEGIVYIYIYMYIYVHTQYMLYIIDACCTIAYLLSRLLLSEIKITSLLTKSEGAGGVIM